MKKVIFFDNFPSSGIVPAGGEAPTPNPKQTQSVPYEVGLPCTLGASLLPERHASCPKKGEFTGVQSPAGTVPGRGGERQTAENLRFRLVFGEYCFFLFLYRFLSHEELSPVPYGGDSAYS